MNKTLEIKLGFDKIRQQISDRCSTAGGRDLVAEMSFCTSPREVEYNQAVAEEVREALLMEQYFPKGELVEFSAVVSKLAVVGTFLESEELLALRDGLRSVGEITRLFAANEVRYPRMARSETVRTVERIGEGIVGVKARGVLEGVKRDVGIETDSGTCIIVIVEVLPLVTAELIQEHVHCRAVSKADCHVVCLKNGNGGKNVVPRFGNVDLKLCQNVLAVEHHSNVCLLGQAIGFSVKADRDHGCGVKVDRVRIYLVAVLV